MLLLHTDELKDLLSGEEIIECVEAGYRQWAGGVAFNHPRQSLQAGPTRLRIISGAVPELGAIGTRAVLPAIGDLGNRRDDGGPDSDRAY